jgi:mono/diheme cytochrome c family protein
VFYRALLTVTLGLAVPSFGAAQAAPHTAPQDTIDASTYEGWKQFSLQCARCHGDDGLGTSFGPNLLPALKSDGSVPSHEAFLALMASGRPDKGMPSAAKLGIDPKYFDGLYSYLKGRSEGRLKGGRPALKP